MIGEGERDEAPMLYIGEKVGMAHQDRANGRTWDQVDIAVDPLEGTNLCATGAANAIAVLAASESGGLLHAPDMYMDKIAIGAGYPPGTVDLDLSPAENVSRLAKAKGVPVSDIRACLLDRDRHAKIIDELRKAGAGIRLITDGDVAGVFWTTEQDGTPLNDNKIAYGHSFAMYALSEYRHGLGRPARSDDLNIFGWDVLGVHEADKRMS